VAAVTRGARGGDALCFASRLAPEATWPLPLDDGVAAALWLVRSGGEQLGTHVRLIGGESAGARPTPRTRPLFCSVNSAHSTPSTAMRSHRAHRARHVRPHSHQGAQLAVCTMLRLRDEHPSLPPPGELFRGANLVYGWYDLGGTPSMRAFDRRLVFCSQERRLRA